MADSQQPFMTNTNPTPKRFPLLFTHRDTLFDQLTLFARSKQAGLDRSRFEECLKNEGPRVVKADEAGASTIGIVSTPFFLVGTAVSDTEMKVRDFVKGAQPLSKFQEVIDRAIAVPR